MQIIPFSANATPPIGAPLAYAITAGVTNPLQLRGVVLRGDFEPIVLCSVDWIGIAGHLHDRARAVLAQAAGTTADRVAVHCVHQHDAPWAKAEMIPVLQAVDLPCYFLGAEHVDPVFRDAARSIEFSSENPIEATHLGLGSAKVQQVASNRRVLGEDGRVALVRYSACRDPAGRAAPEGLIDPDLRLVSFWNGDEPLLGLAYYACHPQSYYRTGLADADFPGLARQRADLEAGVPHLYFTGAAGNVTAGKWNDGSRASRNALTTRLADAYRRAWANTQRTSIADSRVRWQSVAVKLPLAEDMTPASLDAVYRDTRRAVPERVTAARKLAFLAYHQNEPTATFTRLSLGDADVVHGPSELFVEYQLFAQSLRPGAFVAMAAYGEGSFGYIPTAAAYPQGGYEVQTSVTHLSPDAEAVIKEGLRTLFAT